MKYFTFVFCASVLICSAGFNALPAQAEKPGAVVLFHKTDPDMNAAVVLALASLDVFLGNGIDTDGYSIPGASFKAAFKTPDDGVENIWVSPFALQPDNRIAALLADQPQDLPGLHPGDRVEFSHNMIRDREYFTDGKRYGSHTTRVVGTRLPESQMTPIPGQFANDPYPRGWAK